MRAVSTLGVILFAVNSMNWGNTVAQTMGIDHVLLRLYLLRAGVQRPAAFGLQQGDAREPPLAPDVRLVTAGDVPRHRARLHAQDLRDGRPDCCAVDHLHRVRLVGAVDSRD